MDTKVNTIGLDLSGQLGQRQTYVQLVVRLSKGPWINIWKVDTGWCASSSNFLHHCVLTASCRRVSIQYSGAGDMSGLRQSSTLRKKCVYYLNV